MVPASSKKTMPRPLIGITTSLRQHDGHSSQVIDSTYPVAVERAGGIPLLLPMTSTKATLEPLLELIDALIITGGPGIVTGLISDLPADLPAVATQRAQNDTWAFEAVRQASKPVLGICYGMQFINAQLGGTIYGDVMQALNKAPHSPSRNDGKNIHHPLELAASTHLAHLLGPLQEQPMVNSFHIQAVAKIGAGLQINARSADGLIEGIENADGRVIGVQFHPEKMPQTVWQRLFNHLVHQAGTAS